MDSMNSIPQPVSEELDIPLPEPVALYRSFCQTPSSSIETPLWIRYGKAKKQLLLAQAMLNRAPSSP